MLLIPSASKLKSHTADAVLAPRMNMNVPKVDEPTQLIRTLNGRHQRIGLGAEEAEIPRPHLRVVTPQCCQHRSENLLPMLQVKSHRLTLHLGRHPGN